MDSLILVLTILAIVTLAVSLGNIYFYNNQRRSLKTNIHEAVIDRFTIPRKKPSVSARFITFLSRYADEFSAIGERINFFSESADVEILLKKAGNPYEMTVARFQGFKIVCVILGFVVGSFIVILGLPLANIVFVTLPVLGYFSPILLINQKAKNRQDQLRRELPDFLDTVSISLQAGASLDNSVKEAIPYFIGPLQEEFSRVIQEQELGVPREKAYRELLVRNENEDFQTFVKSIIQSLRLGVPIAETFKHQAEEIRKLSLEQVKEKAAKASPKVTLITSLLIAPLIMLLIMGLVILNMIYGENNVFSFFS